MTTFDTAGTTAYSVQQALLIISPALLAIVQYITLSKLVALAPAAAAAAGRQSSGSGGTASLQQIRVGNTCHAGSSNGSSCYSVYSSPSSPNSRSVAARTSSNGRGGSSKVSSSSSSTSYRLFARAVLLSFTAAQVICLALETSGAALYSNPDANALYGRLLLLSGLGLQLTFDSGFIALTAFVQRSKFFGFRSDKSFRHVFTCMYATTLLMHWRTVFRVAEFSQGREGDVAKHEVYLYVFDFMPLYACFLFFTVMHYGWWLGPQAMLARQQAGAAAAPLDLGPGGADLEQQVQQNKQQMPQQHEQDEPIGDDILHVHCS